MSGLTYFNRAVVFLAGAACIVAGAICLLVVTGVVDAGTLAISGWFRQQFDDLAALSGTDETIAIVASAVVLGFGIFLALVEVMPQRRRATEPHSVADPNGNVVSLPPDSLRMIVEQAAMQVPGVVRASSAVAQSPEGALVTVNALLDSDTHIVEKSSELNDRIRTEIQNRVGVKLAKLRMNLELMRPDQAEAKPRRWGAKREVAAPR